jgi:hypothetical protein
LESIGIDLRNTGRLRVSHARALGSFRRNACRSCTGPARLCNNYLRRAYIFEVAIDEYGNEQKIMRFQRDCFVGFPHNFARL